MFSDFLSFHFFHSGEQIEKYPDLLYNSPDACGYKSYPERTSCGFKNIQICGDKALVLTLTGFFSLILYIELLLTMSFYLLCSGLVFISLGKARRCTLYRRAHCTKRCVPWTCIILCCFFQ